MGIKWLRRTTMVVLFMCAFMTTFQSISGVEAKMLSDWFSPSRFPFSRSSRCFQRTRMSM